MIIAADIGNTNIKFGVFDGNADLLRASFNISSSCNRTSDEYLLLIKTFLSNNNLDNALIDGSVICSVVPSLTSFVAGAFEKLCGRAPFIIGAGTKTGFQISIDSQSELGADIVSNVSEALARCTPPAVVVDMGTAITVAAIDASAVLKGAVICPGMGISIKALSNKAALLFDVGIKKPKTLIGKNSADSICSGSYYGTVYMLDGFIRQLRSELCDENSKLSLISTGGDSAVLTDCRNKFENVPDLTLRGAARLYYKNTK